MSHLPKIIALCGPTASGKSAIAIKLCEKFNGEIINADSRQIYRDFTIGTNAPSEKEKKLIPHHLYQFLSPAEYYSVAEYKNKAITAIHEITNRHKLPLLVGGTGLYIRAVTDNLIIPHVKPNKILRAKLEMKTAEELFNDLQNLDPETATIIDRHNMRRLIRALEIVIIAGQPMAKLKSIGPALFTALKLGIFIDPESLKKKVLDNVKKMLADGLIEETQQLMQKYPLSSPAFSSLAYQSAIAFLNKSLTKRELIEKIALSHYHYSKRQMTWFKKEKNVIWVSSYSEAEQKIIEFLKY